MSVTPVQKRKIETLLLPPSSPIKKNRIEIVNPFSPYSPLQSRTVDAAAGVLCPDSEGFDDSRSPLFSQIRTPVPPTPQKCQISKDPATKLPHLREAARIAEAIEDGDFPIDIECGSKTVRITSARFLGHGDYNEAYLVEGEGLDVDQFVLKIPNAAQRNRGNTNALDILCEELSQYQQLQDLWENQTDFRIASYYDLDEYNHIEASELSRADVSKLLTHGCHLIEYIPDEYPVAPDETEVSDLDDQLKALLGVLPLDTKIDLKRENVGMKDGQLVLLDPLHPQGDEFRVLTKESLKTFAPYQSDRYCDLEAAILN